MRDRIVRVVLLATLQQHNESVTNVRERSMRRPPKASPRDIDEQLGTWQPTAAKEVVIVIAEAPAGHVIFAVP